MEETTKEDKITIVTVCDNNYIMLLASLLKSIEVNNIHGRRIEFYIVEDNIYARNKNKFENSFSDENIVIHWLKMASVVPKEAIMPSDSSTYPLNIYVRLFIPHFIPPEIRRVIYLDVDMVVQKDIVELWETNIGEEIIGAVQDTFGTAFYGIENFKELGIPESAKYFNSGLLLIDTFKWRADDITDKLMNCLERNRKYAKYPDQYGLNVVFANKWFELDSRWNTYTYQIEDDPFLIHYIGYKPIYKDYNGGKIYLDKFYYYLNMTKWAGYTQKSKYVRYISKLKTKLKKLLH